MTQKVEQASIKLLSICIPTHDGRGGTLREALESVVSQIDEALESQVDICISDNASQDETQTLVAQYTQDYPGLIRYHRHPINLGFTRNLMQVIALSQARFCWLLSSDDRIAEGGLKRVRQALEEHPETSGISVFTEGFERDMSARSVHQNSAAVLPFASGEPHVYRTPEEIFRACGLFHGCFSAQIVSRPRWNEVLEATERKALAANVHFPHLYLIGLIVKAHPCWIWLPELTIKARRDNDALTSQLDRNLLRYQLETMRDLSHAWAALLGRRSLLYRTLMARALADQWSGRAILTLKIHTRCRLSDDWAVLAGYTRHLYFLPAFWRSSFPVALVPGSLLRVGFQLKSFGKSILRSRRVHQSGLAERRREPVA